MLAGACLLLVAVAYFSMGLLYLAKGRAIDVEYRWQETQYVLKGVNPNEVLLSNLEVSKPEIFNSIDREAMFDRLDAMGSGLEQGAVPIDPEIGIIRGGSYPPWSHMTLTAYCFSSLKVATVLYALFSLAGLVYIASWSWRTLRRFGAPVDWAFLTLSAVLAFSAYGGAIRWGNLPIVVFALVLASISLSDRKRWILAGLLLGIACVKPTVALPFAGIFVVRGRWGSLVVAAVYSAIATGFTWFKTGTAPHVFLEQCSDINLAITMGKGVGLVQTFMSAGVDRELAYKGVLLGVVTLTALALLLIRKSESLVLVAVCALGARLWTYHHYFDNLIFTPLLLVLSLLAYRERSRTYAVLATVLALTLILPNVVPKAPSRFNDIYTPALFAAGHLVWIIATITVLAAVLRRGSGTLFEDSTPDLNTTNQHESEAS